MSLRVARLAALLALFFSLTGTPAHAQSAATAQYFVAELVGRAGVVIRDAALSPLDRRERFRALVVQRFDVPEIARYVLGRHWEAASETERADFILAFADYMVAIYAPRIAAYGDAAFTVIGQRDDGTSAVIVSSSVARPDDAPLPVEWRASRVADAYKITDVIVSGVSLMKIKRAEIGSVIDFSDGRLPALLTGATTLIRCG
jgi:phospholipid transport system substrate-binding protein